MQLYMNLVKRYIKLDEMRLKITMLMIIISETRNRTNGLLQRKNSSTSLCNQNPFDGMQYESLQVKL